ncbi:Crp/Fnr family transcriptional regulator [Streptomyces sp. SL13]|uniref:Crp/Fnr family transcriptional regulator n=1 Tax=Streptantibioticus silvisoli TaxID=2705255 RepID=A0AA90H623_9ACTN|nr:Crp/Fnr family transcriptional regulator [Streptantibioticus silvisoli]MDI5971560.1 Crp/Fnr family transcriptional regulator [Streptantibioticus silvisoli]
MDDTLGTAAADTGHTLRRLIGEEIWAALLADAVVRPHRPGDILLRQGAPGTHVLAVLEGTTKVVRLERDGELKLLAFRGPGELLGEVAVLDEEVRLATVEALSHCRVAVVSKDRFMAFTDRHDLYPVLLRHSLNRFRESERARVGGDPLGRLADTLARLAVFAGTGHCSGDRIELALSRNELAQHLGISRNTVSTLLTVLGPHGVRAGRMRIVVDDLATLRRVAGGAS